MATKTIKGIRTEKVDVTSSGDTWNLHKNATIVSIDFGFFGALTANNNTFNIDGDIFAVYGVFGQGPRMTVNVGHSGLLQGSAGIIMAGTDRLDVDVDGQILGAQYGIQSVAARTTVDVGRNGTIEGMYGIYAMGTTRFSADIDGEVIGTQYGIVAAAATSRVTVGGHGEVDGAQYGVYFAGSGGGRLVNHGSIASAGGIGANFVQPGAKVYNDGEITGMYGISAVGKGTIVNDEHGAIIGTYGILASSTGGQSFKIVNHGTIIAPETQFAIVAGDGNDRIISDGRMVGNVVLGSGNDVLNLLHGSAKGDFFGNTGDDTLITDKASHKLIENAGEGIDTVKSTVDYKLSPEVERLILLGGKDIDGTGNATANTLRGNSGDNILKGLAGADELFGNKGNDKLYGGGDGDIFHFSSGDGKDKVMDLAIGVDDVDLSGWNAINTFTQLLNHAKNDGNGNVVIKAGDDSLTIMHLEKGDLDMNDFIF
ncbi:MAG: calcium-binding protein [Rhizobiaceae bacterium]|nr:calcium-binding protein [Rhizobiaceae bacterium]